MRFIEYIYGIMVLPCIWYHGIYRVYGINGVSYNNEHNIIVLSVLTSFAINAFCRVLLYKFRTRDKQKIRFFDFIN